MIFGQKPIEKWARSAAHMGISFSAEPNYLALRQNETSGLTHVATVEGGAAAAETWLRA
jgi:hypothetical protein